MDHTIAPNDKLVILGGNGSGKSTLLQVISGFVTPNEGTITYAETQSGNLMPPEEIRKVISFASPYLQLIEEFTLREIVEHTAFLKPFKGNITINDFITRVELQAAENKFIRQFSSGMKQRLKLALAILADTPVLLLDEPVSNLDKNAIEWYKGMIQENTSNRTVVVCSNAITDEFFFCDKELDVTDYKATVLK